MVRSFDDSNVDMLSHYGSIQQQQQQNPQYGVRGGLVQQEQQPPQHHSMALNSQNVGGGGTLPRALVKPRPIAKISAILSNPQQGQLHQSDFQSSDLCKKTFASSSDNLKQTVRTMSYKRSIDFHLALLLSVVIHFITLVSFRAADQVRSRFHSPTTTWERFVWGSTIWVGGALLNCPYRFTSHRLHNPCLILRTAKPRWWRDLVKPKGEKRQRICIRIRSESALVLRGLSSFWLLTLKNFLYIFLYNWVFIMPMTQKLMRLGLGWVQ